MQAVFHVQSKCLFIVTAAKGCLHTRGEEDERKEQMINALTKQVRLVEKNYVSKLFFKMWWSGEMARDGGQARDKAVKIACNTLEEHSPKNFDVLRLNLEPF